ITFAGTPTATENSGTSLVTTLPAPIVHPLPIVTPGITVVFPPIQQSSPIVMGKAYSTRLRREATLVSCVAENSDTFGPNSTRFPILTMLQSRMERLSFWSAPC
ncbi:hypothetical protein BGZ61DRAFT_350933, partial [Ilyonectria robusta]|uniref:uncharacterized protein n=1 Tax=Ilyonectria robusta TaxID=1079257 RepID=UPI001E8DA8B1